MKYQQFIFESYEFDAPNRTLRLRYSYDNERHFTETYVFDFPFVQYDPTALDRALQQLFYMAGVSYYKAYLAPEIIIQQGNIDATLQAFLSKTYQKGLGEFLYVNRLDPRIEVPFPVNAPLQQPVTTQSSGAVVGIGGGKDSLVSIELLRDTGLDIATWSLDHREQLEPLVQRIGLPHYWVQRIWDPELTQLKFQGAYRGHVPISAIIACTGTIVGILTGRRDHIVSNEASANEPTLTYQGTAINHQYSKTTEFETDYQTLLVHQFGNTQRYYSLPRSMSELYMAELFAKTGFAKYKDVFSSCNKAFSHTSNHMFWDGICPKCAFVSLVLAPFVSREALEQLFNGTLPLLNSELTHTYEQLLGISGDKPLECVGEIRESRTAMRMCQAAYPELTHYQFDLPVGYNYRELGPHNVPADVWGVVSPRLAQ